MTKGSFCCVGICDNSSAKAKRDGKEVRFFRFPKDDVTKQQWIVKCYRKDFVPSESARICSIHFTNDDFVDKLKAEMLHYSPKVLKKTAIPSLYLLPSKTKPPGDERWAEAYDKRRNMRQKLLEELLKEVPKRREQGIDNNRIPIILKKNTRNLNQRSGLAGEIILSGEVDKVTTQDENFEESAKPTAEPPSASQPLTSAGKESNVDDLKTKFELLSDQNKKILRDLNTSNERIKFLEERLSKSENANKELELKVFKLKSALRDSTRDFDERVKVAFKDFLTPNQIEIVLKKKTKARWTQEELSKAFTFRYLSKRCYVYLRENCNYPLPGLSTLRRWAGSIDLRSGILADVLKIMSTTGATKTEMQRITVLSVDEAEVSSVYEYDRREDEIVGPHSYMQIVTARGLCDAWKQPVYIGFDQKMTRNVLSTIISKLHDIQYNVVACVFDCRKASQELWRDFGVSITQSYISHPDTSDNIYFFADTSHLLTLLRSWFVETGFVLADGGIIDTKPIEELLKTTCSEASCVHNLCESHINNEKTERKNLELATELFSHFTASALKKHLPGDDQDAVVRLIGFVEVVSDWFDLVSSSSTSAPSLRKRPFGMHINEQTDIVNKMLSMISALTCLGTTSLQSFQEGIILSAESIQGLFSDMEKNFKVEYILSHKLNKESLETFFSQPNVNGDGYEPPSPLYIVNRIRTILLGENSGAQLDAIVKEEDSVVEEFLVTDALQKAGIEIEEPDAKNDFMESLQFQDGSVSSSSSTSSSESGKLTTDKSGLLYLAGYLAKKHGKEFKYLRKPSSKGKSHPFGSENFADPSSKWLIEVNEMEMYFEKMHKDTLKKTTGVLRQTTDYITIEVQNRGINEKLIEAFCEHRIYMRIKYLNAKEEVKKTKKRASSPDVIRKVGKKRKILVT